MYSIDGLLIDPRRGQLEAAMYEAVDAVHRDLQGEPGWPGTRLDVCTRRELESLWNEVESQASGHRLWQARPRNWQYVIPGALLVVWWSDYLSRQHVRIVGGCASKGETLPAPSSARPPLACVYPERCVLVNQHRRYRLLVVCACGAWGTPEQVAWMGPCCGPCSDRQEDEAAPELGWRMGKAAVEHLAVAPDGRRLACLDAAGRLQARELPTGRLLEERASFAADKLAVSADGELLALGSRDARHTEVMGPAGAWVTEEFPFAFPRQGQGVFLHDDADGLVLWDLASAQVVRPFVMSYPLRLHDLATSPDGRLLAGAAGPSGVCFWDVYTGRARGLAQIGNCSGALAFSPDGTALGALVGDRGRYRHVALYDLHAGRVRASLGTANVGAFAFSPDGAWLVTTEEDTLRVWDVHTALERRALSPGDSRETLGPVAFTPDGRFVLLGTNGGVVRLWPAELLLPE